MKTNRVTLYTKENCPLCDKAEEALIALKKEWPYTIETIDIYKDDHLLEKYQIRIPVVEVNNRVVAEGIVTVEGLKIAFCKLFK